MINLEINQEILKKCNFAYTVFCNFLEVERDSLDKGEIEFYKARFLFDLLYNATANLDSDYLVEDLQKLLS